MDLAGFPASFFDHDRDGVELKVVDGSLRIRSPRTASRYVGAQQPALLDGDGFVDTGDMVELRGDRYVFAGRKGGIINIGGLKVHPEEIEAVINRHPQVRMSLVRPKKSPVTGAIVIADVVLRTECGRASCRDTGQRRHTGAVPRRIAAPQSAGCHQFRPVARRRGDRKIVAPPWLRPRAPFSSPARAAALGSASRASSRLSGYDVVALGAAEDQAGDRRQRRSQAGQARRPAFCVLRSRRASTRFPIW